MIGIVGGELKFVYVVTFTKDGHKYDPREKKLKVYDDWEKFKDE